MKGNRSKHWIITGLILIMLTLSMDGFAAKALPEQPIDINHASTETLMSLPGIGKSKAQAILKFRNDHAFAQPEDLMKVKGIGKRLYAKLKPYIRIGGSQKGKKQAQR